MNIKNLCILSFCTLFFSASSAATTSDQPRASQAAEHGIAGYSVLPESVKQKLAGTSWLKRPTWQTAVKAALWVGGPVALSIYLNTILKKDKKARQLKLKKQQPQDAGNPMAQLMMMMQMQQGGASPFGGSPFGDDMPEGGMIDAMKQQEPVDITYNENDILSPRRRKVFEVLLFMSRALAILGIVNAVDVAKDFWKGNTMPGAVRAHVNASIEFEKNKAQLYKEWKATPARYKPAYEVQVAKKNGFPIRELVGVHDKKTVSHDTQKKLNGRTLLRKKNSRTISYTDNTHLGLLKNLAALPGKRAELAIANAEAHGEKSGWHQVMNTIGLPVLANTGISASSLVQEKE